MSSVLRPRTALVVSLPLLAGGTPARLAPGPFSGAGVRAEPDVTWIMGPTADRARLDAWRAGVGPAVVLPGAHAEPDGPWPGSGSVPGGSALDDVTVISWNTNVGGGDLHSLLTDLRAGRLTNGDSVRHFVLLLQEVYRAGEEVPRGQAVRPRRIAARPRQGARSDIVAVARAHGLHLFYVPSMANGWEAGDTYAEDRGNAIVSTLPLSGHTAIELPFEGQRRVAASATITVTTANGGTRSLRAVSVHLDNRSAFHRVLRSFGSGRARQAEALATALVRDSAALLPTVLAGDLNTWAPPAWERAVKVLRTHFPAGNAMRVPTFAGPPTGLGRTLDHMMFRIQPADRLALPSAAQSVAPLRGPGDSVSLTHVAYEPPVSVRLDDARGSDHFPLLARLRLTGGD